MFRALSLRVCVQVSYIAYSFVRLSLLIYLVFTPSLKSVRMWLKLLFYLIQKSSWQVQSVDVNMPVSVIVRKNFYLKFNLCVLFLCVVFLIMYFIIYTYNENNKMKISKKYSDSILFLVTSYREVLLVEGGGRVRRYLISCLLYLFF